MITTILPTVTLIKFIECLGDLYGMIECFPILGIHLRSVAKLINSNVQAKKMKKLTNRIKDDWTVRSGDFDKTILKSYAERSRLLTVIYTVYMFSCLALYLTVPVIPIVLDIIAPLNQSRDKVYLFQTEYFVDQDEQYFYILLHAYITVPLALAILVAYDTMYAVYVHHACSIFASLRFRLQSVGNIASHNKVEIYNGSKNCTGEAYDDIVACIKIHNEAVEIAKLIESSSYNCLLFVVGASMLTITVTGVMTVKSLDRPGEALRFGFVTIGELIHLFYICWQGQVIIEHSQDIFTNAYNVEWFSISPRAKKLLVLIMMRSLEPCKLTAGKIFVLSMESYAAALKTSMSYFTVLMSV